MATQEYHPESFEVKPRPEIVVVVSREGERCQAENAPFAAGTESTVAAEAVEAAEAATSGAP